MFQFFDIRLSLRWSGRGGRQWREAATGDRAQQHRESTMKRATRLISLSPIMLSMAGVQPTESFAAAPAGIPAEQANPACRAGEAYVAAGNAQDSDRIARIFADKVDYTGPDGIHRDDHSDIAAVYKRYTGKMDLVRRVSHAGPIDEHSCLVEMESSENGGAFSPSAVVHLEVDASGKITRFLPYVLTARARWLAEVLQK